MRAIAVPRYWVLVVAVVCGVTCALPHATRAAEASPSSPSSSSRQWADRVFGDGTAATTQPAPAAPTLIVKRQDFGQLEFGESVIHTTPLKIGAVSFSHGLGTHANSEIVLKIPPGPAGLAGPPGAAKRFTAVGGIDNNPDTAGRFGSVVLSIEIAGKEVFKSDVKRGGEEGTPVDVAIPADATEILLKVNDAGDGPSHDQTDWADAKLILADGQTIFLDTLPAPQFWPGGAGAAAGGAEGATQLPFSFTYGGKSSRDLLPQWKHEATTDGKTRTARWTDPATGLRVTAIATAFDDFSAVEWLARFENTGSADTPILENVQALDAVLPAPAGGGQGASAQPPVVLDQIRGDDASENSFVPIERTLATGESVHLAPAGGRPSSGTFPMFALERGSEHTFIAIGWTGQWASTISRDAEGVRVQAGMELTHLKLHPGESIRTPRILLMNTRGDRTDAHNAFRRLLLAHYVPRYDGELPKFAIAAQTFNMVFGAGIRPEWATEAGQIAAAKIEKQMGCDTHWFDAGWFDGNFPMGVGNWTVKQKEFPRGLAPVGKACDDLGLRFLVWYEPERVAPNTKIAREHPEFLLSAGQPKINGGLFNLGDEKARRWMTDLILQQLHDYHIDTYRNDFNMDPLAFWRANDEPDRQGITEIRYVEGFYQFWDELRAKTHEPLDDCASGGRRIDLEMISRSIVQTRSDFAVAPGRSLYHQCQTFGLSLFLPLHATIGWETDTYSTRSAATNGICFEWDILDPKFPVDAGRAAIEEIKSNQKYWSGDFYPLTKFSTSDDACLAWQLHRPDLNEGMILAFRRETCPYSALQLDLHGIDPARSYQIEILDDSRKPETKTIPGRELKSLELHLPTKRSSVLVRYAPAP